MSNPEHICPLSSYFCPLSSYICPLSSYICPPSSYFRPLSSYFRPLGLFRTSKNEKYQHMVCSNKSSFITNTVHATNGQFKQYTIHHLYAQKEELPCHKPPHLSKSQILCCLSVNRTPIGSKELTTVHGTPGMSTHWPLSSLMLSRPHLNSEGALPTS